MTLIQCIVLSNNQSKINLSVGADVGISTSEGDADIVIKLSMAQFERLMDKYRSQIGELTIEELEDVILEQQRQIEELKKQLEVQEQYKELRKEQIDEHEVF